MHGREAQKLGATLSTDILTSVIAGLIVAAIGGIAGLAFRRKGQPDAVSKTTTIGVQGNNNSGDVAIDQSINNYITTKNKVENHYSAANSNSTSDIDEVAGIAVLAFVVLAAVRFVYLQLAPSILSTLLGAVLGVGAFYVFTLIRHSIVVGVWPGRALMNVGQVALSIAGLITAITAARTIEVGRRDIFELRDHITAVAEKNQSAPGFWNFVSSSLDAIGSEPNAEWFLLVLAAISTAGLGLAAFSVMALLRWQAFMGFSGSAGPRRTKWATDFTRLAPAGVVVTGMFITVILVMPSLQMIHVSNPYPWPKIPILTFSAWLKGAGTS